MKISIYQDVDGDFRWRLRARNGRILADSGEGYASRWAARDALRKVRRGIGDATVE